MKRTAKIFRENIEFTSQIIGALGKEGESQRMRYLDSLFMAIYGHAKPPTQGFPI